jgi:hypothetical protein
MRQGHTARLGLCVRAAHLLREYLAVLYLALRICGDARFAELVPAGIIEFFCLIFLYLRAAYVNNYTCLQAVSTTPLSTSNSHKQMGHSAGFTGRDHVFPPRPPRPLLARLTP